MSQRGFTLIEMIIVIGIMSVVMVVLSQMFLGTERTYRTQNAELNVNFAARSTLDDIDAYVRQATKALGTYTTYTAGPSVLILEIPSVNSSNQLVPGTYDKVVFTFSANRVERIVIADAASTRLSNTKLLADNVTDLTFTYNNADFAQVTKVQTDISVIETSGRDTRSIDVSTISYMRN
jgi:prepilin-type N-terminal cleavage/methylation domain-containing protein